MKMFHFDVRSIHWCFGTLSVHFQNTVRPRDTRPWDTWISQVLVFELGQKKFEMNEFMKRKPWAAQFSDHMAFTLSSNKSCTNFELHKFFLSQKDVLLNALLYYFKKVKKLYVLNIAFNNVLLQKRAGRKKNG